MVCAGHQLRAANQKAISKYAKSAGITVDPYKTVLITKGPGGPISISLKDLAEEFRKTPEWVRMEKGGMLSIPVVRFRLMEHIRPDKSNTIDYQAHLAKKVAKGKKDIDAFRQDETDQRINKEIRENFEQLQLTRGDQAARLEIKKSKLYQTEQRWQDVKAEDLVIESIEKTMEKLNLPCLLVKGSKLGHIGALREMGLINIPPGAEDAETDILLAFATPDKLQVVLMEVKRPDSPPWNKDTLPDKQNINKAETQIGKDITNISTILEDIPGGSIVFSGHSCFPTCSSASLDTLFCAPCLGGVITKDDLDDKDSLRKKLGIPDTGLASAQSKELLLALSSRVAGQASRLHLHYRTATEKGKLQMTKQEANIRAIDREIEQQSYVVLSEDQQAIVSQFSQSLPSDKSLIIRGRAGCGKTLVITAVAKAMAAQHTNPLTILTNGCNLEDTDALIQHLQQQFQPEAAAGNLIINTMKKLLRTFSLDPASYRTSNDNQNMPAMISALSVAAAAQHPGRHIVMVLDECYAHLANLTTDGKYDWTCLSVPGSVQVCLAFNPSTPRPVLLPTDQRYLSVVGEIRYRSTGSINTMVNYMAHRIGWDKCVEEEDQTATDVKGELPVILNCPQATTEQIKRAMDKVRDIMAEQGTAGSVTLLVDTDFLTPDTRQAVRAAGQAWGWTVCDSTTFTGWEDDCVVSVGRGDTEYISRARLALYVVLAWQVGKYKYLYDEDRDAFIGAQQEGLVQYQDMDTI